MADLSDVETALTAAVVAIVYPGGPSVSSVTGDAVKIYRGWPSPIGLNADLVAQISNVSIFPDAKSFLATSRHPPVWRELSMAAPTLTALTGDRSVTFGGFGGLGQVAGIRVDEALYSVALSASDTPLTVAVALSAMIPGATLTGAKVSVESGNLVLGRVAGSGISCLETRRQEQGFVISLWSADPVTRDSLGSLIDSSLSMVDWLEFSDGSAGQLRSKGSAVVDAAENANLYRRNLTYTVEYPTILLQASSAMLFGYARLADQVGSISLEPIVASQSVSSRLGAIRFDAWYDPQDTIDQQCAAALFPEAWHDRLPPNAIVSSNGVAWPLAGQQVLDAEIEAAASAGLSFWAFDSYKPADGLSRALTLYLASAVRDRLLFCMIGQASNWADQSTPSGYSSALDRDITMMVENGYLRVLENRPVYFVLDATEEQLAMLPGDGVAEAIAYIRNEVLLLGVGNPYIVWLSGAAIVDFDNAAVARSNGSDAAAAYACPRLSGVTQPYAALVASTEQDWLDRAATGFGMVPTAMTGWDQRPLIETPQSFYPVSRGSLDYYESGEPSEIADHVGRSADFIAAHAIACPAGIGLIYAWNELVEGGWLMPTFGTGTSNQSRVEALRLCLDQWQPVADNSAIIIA